jgi:hypothetical protein
MRTKFSLESLKERDLGVDGEDNIKIDIREIKLEDVDWIHLAQDRDMWRALVNTVMNLTFHKRKGIS